MLLGKRWVAYDLTYQPFIPLLDPIGMVPLIMPIEQEQLEGLKLKIQAQPEPSRSALKKPNHSN